MVISSLVVDTLPDYTQQVAQQLPTLSGVEVHEINGSKLVVTIEAETVDESHDISTSFMQFTGVMSIGLVYCNFEDDPTLQ